MDVYKETLLCLIKTLLEKPIGAKLSEGKRVHNNYQCCLVNNLLGKPSETKPWLREKEYNMILSPAKSINFPIEYINFTYYSWLGDVAGDVA